MKHLAQSYRKMKHIGVFEDVSELKYLKALPFRHKEKNRHENESRRTALDA